MDDDAKVMATVRRILKQFGELPRIERSFLLDKMLDVHSRKTKAEDGGTIARFNSGGQPA